MQGALPSWKMLDFTNFEQLWIVFTGRATRFAIYRPIHTYKPHPRTFFKVETLHKKPYHYPNESFYVFIESTDRVIEIRILIESVPSINMTSNHFKTFMKCLLR
ncbi:hypothetical protein RF11_03919 [Thelohanellus kitauei]|uniref:Uncharacterized protein n=1 Tax=Thelohanellus kitauei TaxID=669202 RepID=A0A0C2MJ14_THEKT|nr:hypothetical protein RF11_03919 [Thelohanellus kitauei]